MAASSSPSATIALPSFIPVSRKSPFLSSIRVLSNPFSMRRRTVSPSRVPATAAPLGSVKTLDATEVVAESAVAPLHGPVGAEEFSSIGESTGFPKGITAEISSSQCGVSSLPEQKVVVRNAHGENIVGILHETGSVELVILCHGFRSSKESKTLMNLADALVSGNISVFRFDFAGNGDSDGSFQYGNYWREVEDLRSVVQHFSGQRRKVHAIVGHSKGGNVVLLYASKHNDISTVVNISGRFNLVRGIDDRLGKDFMERIKKDGFIDVMDNVGRFIYRVTEESLIDRLNTNMHAACLSIDKNCRILTVHGSEDDVVPPEDAFEFGKLIINHKLHIIEGADHRFISHQNDLARILMEFIR